MKHRTRTSEQSAMDVAVMDDKGITVWRGTQGDSKVSIAAPRASHALQFLKKPEKP